MHVTAACILVDIQFIHVQLATQKEVYGHQVCTSFNDYFGFDFGGMTDHVIQVESVIATLEYGIFNGAYLAICSS